MKKALALTAILGLLLASGCAKKQKTAVAPVEVPKVMLSLLANYKGLKSDFLARNYPSCRQRFETITGLFDSLGSVLPRKGDKSTWDAIHAAAIAAARTGITGCGLKNDAVVSASIDALTSAMRTGHKIFREPQ